MNIHNSFDFNEFMQNYYKKLDSETEIKKSNNKVNNNINTHSKLTKSSHFIQNISSNDLNQVKTTKKDYKSNENAKNYKKISNIQKNSITRSHNIQIGFLKPHIIINPRTGVYTLLDSNLNIIDKIYSNNFFILFTRYFRKKKFKKQLNKDYKNYLNYCKKNKIKPNFNFKMMHKKIKFYLWLCPDADYDILELLRKNITKVNPNYKNYQTACAEYLRELARYSDGNPDNLPFDINIAANDIDRSNHRYLVNCFGKCKKPIEAFRNLMPTFNLGSEENLRQKYNIYTPQKSKFLHTKKVLTPKTMDIDR